MKHSSRNTSNKKYNKSGNNKHGGKKIRGQLDPFNVYMDNVIKYTRTLNDWHVCRDALKDIVAQRMGVTMLNRLKIDESNIDDICDVIAAHFGLKIVDHFISCSLKFYAEIKQPCAEIDKTCSSCAAREKYKSVRHARQDCFACAEHYIKKLKEIYKNNQDILDEICCADKALRFVADYIYNMQVGVIPKTINGVVFNRALTLDEKIKNCYEYSEGNYVRKNNKTKYNVVDLRAATELYCQGYKL